MRILLLAVIGCLLMKTTVAQVAVTSGKLRESREQLIAGKSDQKTAPKPQPKRSSEQSGRKADAEPSDRQPKHGTEGARLSFDVATYDFGDVPRKGGDLVREFTFTNVGTTPLVLVRVLTSCSCLKASYSKRPVSPGGKGVISITYEPHKSEPGAFNKVIQVFSNSTGGRDVITVQGNSIDEEQVKLKTDKYKIKTR